MHRWALYANRSTDSYLLKTCLIEEASSAVSNNAGLPELEALRPRIDSPNNPSSFLHSPQQHTKPDHRIVQSRPPDQTLQPDTHPLRPRPTRQLLQILNQRVVIIWVTPRREHHPTRHAVIVCLGDGVFSRVSIAEEAENGVDLFFRVLCVGRTATGFARVLGRLGLDARGQDLA